MCPGCRADEAERWLADIGKHTLQPDVVSYGSVVKAFAKVGDMVGSERWLLEMRAKEVHPDAVAYGTDAFVPIRFNFFSIDALVLLLVLCFVQTLFFCH